MTIPGTGVELELKVSLTPAGYERLRSSLPGRRDDVEQRNLFLDTVDARLAASRWALRLRRQTVGGDPTQVIVTVKGPTTRVAGAVRRTELETDADDALWQAALAGSLSSDEVGGPPGDFLRRELGPRAPLRRVLEFTNHRTTFGLDLAGAPRRLELDRTDYATGERDHELEVEVEPDLASSGAVAEAKALLEVKAVWADLEALLAGLGVGVRPSPGGKLSRGMRYAGRD